MLFFLVFATHQSRSSLPARSSFLPRSHSSLFFSEDCALFSATALSQPLAYQILPHSFHRDGGCIPYRLRHRHRSHASTLFPANLFRMNTCKVYQNKPLYLPLESTLMKNMGGRGVFLLTKHPMKMLILSERSESKDLSFS